MVDDELREQGQGLWDSSPIPVIEVPLLPPPYSPIP